MAITDHHGLLAALHVDSASSHEVKLFRKTREDRFLVQLSDQIIGDMAYDSDPLDAELVAFHLEMIPPQRRGRKRPKI